LLLILDRDIFCCGQL